MRTPYELAVAEIGTVEWRNGNNPKVLGYFADTGNEWVKDDETAWCAAFVGAMLKRAGLKGTGKLNARSYLDWGVPVTRDDARIGDIVVLARGTSSWQGHVGFFEKDNGSTITVLGGNQSNAVNRKPYRVDKGQLLGIRRAKEVRDPRNSARESTIVKTSAAQVLTGAAAGITAVGTLDGDAQKFFIAASGASILTGLIIARERLKMWARGIR